MAKKSKTTKKPTATRKPPARRRKTTTKAIVEDPIVKEGVEPVLAYFKLLTGEEIVGYVDDESSDAVIIVYEPMSQSVMTGVLVLTPYGMASTMRAFFFNKSHVVALYPVDQGMQDLYHLSLANFPRIKALYDQVLFRSAKYSGQRKSVDEVENPVDQAVEEMDAEAKKKPAFETSTDAQTTDDGERSRAKLIDDLVKLAESKGKGINKS